VNVEEERGGGAMDALARSNPLLPTLVCDVCGLDDRAAPTDELIRGEDGRLCVVD